MLHCGDGSQPWACRRAHESALKSDLPLSFHRTRPNCDAGFGDQARAIRLHHGCNHCDRNHQVASSAEFQKGRTGVIQRARDDDSGENFIGAAQGFPVAYDEIRKWYATPSRGRSQFNFGIECQQRGHTVGGRRCITEVAGYGTSVLDLNRANFPGGAFKASKPWGSGVAMTSLQVVSPPIRTESASSVMPLISAMPETSSTGLVTGRSPRAGKKSVPPDKI